MPVILLKKRLRHMSLNVDFAKILGTSLLQKTFG